MPLLKVTDCERATRFCVVANTLEELIKKANTKGTDGSIVVLEEDGTLVDDDEVIKELEKNTLVMIVNSQEAWKPVGLASEASASIGKLPGDQNMPQEKRNTPQGDGNMRLAFDGANLQLRKPTKLETAQYEASEKSDITEKAKIYGRNSSKPLTKYQSAVNDAAVAIARENPVLLLNKGDLMDKAKKKIIENGYVFVKGKSRSKFEESEGPVKKRAKLSSEERTREIESLQENLKILNNRLMFKNQQLQKEKCMSNYKQCDQISAEILEVRKEKKSVDRQLTVLVKKEAKARWYLNSDKSKKSSSKKPKVHSNQSKLPDLLKQDSTSSTSTSTDDTIILSDSDDLHFETYAIMEEDNQELGQVPPQTPVPVDESHAMINEGNQELVQDPPQTPVPIDEGHAVINEGNQELGQDAPRTPVPIDETHEILEENKQDFC